MKALNLKHNGDKILTKESSTIEFKESFHRIEKYAKTMAAFANNNGGFIVFGVKDKPRKLVGLLNDNFENLDEAKITQFLNSHFSPEIQFKKYTERVVGVLEIEESKDKPIVCIKQHNNGGIMESDIYYRYNSRTEKIKYPELVKLFNTIRQNEQNKWQNIFKKIARTNVESITVSKVGDESKSNGFYITNNPDARSVRIDDNVLRDNYPMDYKTLLLKLQERYTNFIQNQKFHKIKRRFIRNQNLCNIRYLDPNNKKSSNKKYYSKDILKKFDEHYTKRP